MSEKLIEEIAKRLEAKTIHDIRQIARAVGVPRPADGRKERIIENILQIATGETDPSAPSVRGAHPKSTEYDRQLVADILRCREINLFKGEITEEKYTEMSVGSGERSDPFNFTAGGILEKTDGKWFIRANGGFENQSSLVFVNEYFINNFNLREGDYVSGNAKRNTLDEIAGLVSVSFVNGLAPAAVKSRRVFENLSCAFPDRSLRVAVGSDDTAGRMVDLFSPLGAGQRVLIKGAHGSGKTTLLKNIANGLKSNYPELKEVFLLIDSRPEEAADFNNEFSSAAVFSSSFDAGVSAHLRTAKLALEFCKRLTELGNDTVLFLDDLNRLTRAYNSSGRVTAYLDAAALDLTKKLLASARNCKEGGSLTIVSVLNYSEDQFDEAVCSGLKDLGNVNISLSNEYALKRVYPAFDLNETRTSGAERLVSEEILSASAKLVSENDLREIIKLFKSTDSNEQLCSDLGINN